MDLKNIVTCDIECYKNYFLIMFREMTSGKVLSFEKFNDSKLNTKNIMKLLNKYTVVTFNGINYDLLIIDAALSGYSNEGIYKVSCAIIEKQLKYWEVRSLFNLNEYKFNHIDLREVAPSQASLKLYAGRMQCGKMQDLPIDPHRDIEASQLELMRLYCENDLVVTQNLFDQLQPELELRCKMSDQYNVDLRSKSDAQIAEAVLKSELKSKYHIDVKKVSISPGTEYFYTAPDFIDFESDVLNDILIQYKTLPCRVKATGHPEFNFKITESDRKRNGKLPEKKPKLYFDFFNNTYTAGLGGLHSKESPDMHDSIGYILREYDVASYYPAIIINNKLYPKHLGVEFLDVYKSIVDRRLKAKASGDKITSDSLKITINGTFGKFASKYSFLYSPQLLIQATITGQLCLLMLIERLELAGVSVISANTDGIVTKFKPELDATVTDIVDQWEFDTGFVLESNDYKAYFCRDVNNYLAVTETTIKGKGVFADQKNHYNRLRNNPVNLICIEAVKKFLTENIPVESTIMSCTDINMFTSIQTVKGGAVKDGVELGKVVRWYYGTDELDCIYYKISGNKVPNTDCAVPVMDLPDSLPGDLDYNRYIKESNNLLDSVNYFL